MHLLMLVDQPEFTARIPMHLRARMASTGRPVIPTILLAQRRPGSTALVPMSMAPVDAVPHSVPAGMMATALALNRIPSVIFQRHTTLATYTAIRAMAMPVRHAHQHGRSSPRPTGLTSTGTAIAAISPAHSRDTTVSMKMTTIGAGSIAPAQHHMVPTPTGVTLRLHRGIHDGISTL